MNRLARRVPPGINRWIYRENRPCRDISTLRFRRPAPPPGREPAAAGRSREAAGSRDGRAVHRRRGAAIRRRGRPSPARTGASPAASRDRDPGCREGGVGGRHRVGSRLGSGRFSGEFAQKRPTAVQSQTENTTVPTGRGYKGRRGRWEYALNAYWCGCHDGRLPSGPRRWWGGGGSPGHWTGVRSWGSSSRTVRRRRSCVPASVLPSSTDGPRRDGGRRRGGCARSRCRQFDAGRDAGPFDAGPFDAGPFDAGPFDAGPFDAGPFDAGPFDAGPFDAGPFDAGEAKRTARTDAIDGTRDQVRARCPRRPAATRSR